MSKYKRILVTFAVVGAICVVYLWFFGAATMFALEARYVGWKAPVVKRTPTELPDRSIAQIPGRKLAYFGYEFEVPWEIDEAKSKPERKLQLVVFRSGNAMLVSRSAAKEFVNNFLSTGNADPAGLRALYGEDALQSDYSLKERILEATPDKVGLLTPRREAAGDAMLLILKGVMMHGGAESGIYRIQTGDFRGFQFGDPRSRPRSLEVEVYNGEGGMYFSFFQRTNGTQPPITQAEINGILQSLRKSNGQN